MYRDKAYFYNNFIFQICIFQIKMSYDLQKFQYDSILQKKKNKKKKFEDLKSQMQEQKNKYKHFITEFKNLVNENRIAHEMQIKIC